MATFGRTSNFTRFVLLHIYKIHFTKTRPQAAPLQPLVKSQMISFFNFPLKFLNEFIIAQLPATRATCYILLDSVTPIKLTINYKCTISLYILSCVSLFPLSLLTHTAQWRCVCTACYCLSQFATYMSRFGCRKFTTPQHV